MGRKDFTYTSFGEVHTETDANGNVTTFAYDALGRVTSSNVAGPNENATSTFVFDKENNATDKCIGLISSEKKGDGSEFAKTYHYDTETCLLEKVITKVDGEDFEVKTQFDTTYGRAKAVTYPTGLTIANEYNEYGYLKRVYNPVSNYTYREINSVDEQGSWITASYANNQASVKRQFLMTTGQMDYSEWYSRNSLQQKVDYTYGDYSNLTKQRVDNDWLNTGDSAEETYAYDNLHRLKSSSLAVNNVAVSSVSYSYDNVGNIKRKTDFSTDDTSAYQYGHGARSATNGWAGPNAVRSVSLYGGGTRTYDYDNNGNLTSDGIRTVSYNAFNKPISISVASGLINPALDSQSTASSNAQLFYSSNQMRYKQIKTANNETTTIVYIDKLFEKITKQNASNVVTSIEQKSYIGDIAVVTQKEVSGDTTFEATYYHRDRLGSMIAEIGVDGAVKQGHSFDAFGRPRDVQMKNKSPLQQLLGISTNRGFTDHEHLDESQLIHMNGRVYDYNLGRFLSVDPFIQAPGNSQSMNPYSYIMNNPLAGTDPSGYIGEIANEAIRDAMVEHEGMTHREANENIAKETVRQAVVIVETADSVSDVAVPVKGLVKQGVKQAVKQGVKEVKQALKNGKDTVQSAKPKGSQQPSEINSQKQVAQQKNSGCSFIAGTLVATPLGFREIQDLEVGDLVKAKNDQTDEVEGKKINAVFDELHKEVIELTIKLPDGKSEVITTTAEHPFMLYDGEWLPAGELKVGAFVETIGGLKAEVVGFEIIKEQQVAYNFEVDEFHTYAVGEGELWVHNKCKETETIVRRMNAEEADATVKAKGLVPGDGKKARKAKWVSEKTPQKGLDNKTHKKTAVFKVEKGTTDWLKGKSKDMDKEMLGETSLPNGVLTKPNEQGALGIGKDLIEDFNKKVKEVEIK